MLILPLDRRLDWKHPPIITIALLAANILIFLFAQLNDDREAMDAAVYYSESGLAALEVPRYRQYLERREHEALPEEMRKAADDWPGWMWQVQTDVDFQRRLQGGWVITRLSDDYQDWLNKRQRFEEAFAQITFVEHGLRTAKPSIETLFSHMFLHAGAWHLIGNALFLVAVGFLVEATMNRWLFLATYLLAGLGSAGFNFLFDPPSLVPGIGASGAISGLMGMYAVLYGLRRIRFFYSIGIYFDYVRLPAIVLLPAWIGNELLQIWLYPESNINYMAHLGGLLTGAVLAFGVKYLPGAHDMRHIEAEDAKENFEAELAEARRLCDAFEYRKALPVLRRLFQQQPEHASLLNLYHEAARIDPAGDDYHLAANQLMRPRPEHSATPSDRLAVYREYLRLARPAPRFKASSLAAMLPVLLQHDELADAERIVKLLSSRSRRDSALAPLVRQLARSLQEAGESQKASHYRQLAESWGS